MLKRMLLFSTLICLSFVLFTTNAVSIEKSKNQVISKEQRELNKEISAINNNMKKATRELEERQVEKAAKRQQLVMMSTNNLALLLSEILEQMQKDLEMSPSQCNKPTNCNKPNPNCKKPSMSQLNEAQKNLNKEMKKGKNGKKGE